jgi:hypothetical protein
MLEDSWQKIAREINKSLFSFLPFVFQFPSFSIGSPNSRLLFSEKGGN